MEKSADSIQNNVKSMIKLGKATYTDDEAGKKAQESDKDQLLKYIRKFVSDYNEVNSDLADLGGATNTSFKKALDNLASSDKAALKEVGITVTGSGELEIDEKTLTGADFDKLKALFAKDSGFAGKVSAKMEIIENTAASSLTTMNKLYGATSTYNKYGTGNTYFNGYGNYSNYNYGNYGSNSGWYF